MRTRITFSFFFFYGLFFSIGFHKALYSISDISGAGDLPVMLDDMHDFLHIDDDYDGICERSQLEPFPWWKSLIIWSYDRGSYCFDKSKVWFQTGYEKFRKYLIHYGYTVWLRKSAITSNVKSEK